MIGLKNKFYLLISKTNHPINENLSNHLFLFSNILSCIVLRTFLDRNNIFSEDSVVSSYSNCCCQRSICRNSDSVSIETSIKNSLHNKLLLSVKIPLECRNCRKVCRDRWIDLTLILRLNYLLLLLHYHLNWHRITNLRIDHIWNLTLIIWWSWRRHLWRKISNHRRLLLQIHIV